MTGKWRSFSELGAAAIVLVLFTVAAVVFARHQAIWVDETTQLFGLTLSLQPQAEWLSGVLRLPSGVPPDRAVPMSYWVGGIWAALFGLGEMQMRLFGIACMLVGAPAIWLAGRRLAGYWGAFFALAAIYLAPGMVVQAVEIRAYPLFFAFCSWAVWAFVEVLERPPVSRRHLALLALFLVLANYTHFFGIVLSALLGLTLVAVFLSERRPLLPLLMAALAALILSVGVLPFLMGALAVTGRGATATAEVASLGEALRDTVRLAFRLVLHGSAFAVRPVVPLALLSLAALLLMAIATQWRTRALWVALPLFLGFLILPLLKLQISGLDVLAPHYNLWMVPVVILFLAGAFRSGARLWNLLPTGLLLATHLVVAGVLLTHARAYSHGPGEWLAGLVENPERTLIIHDAQGPWGQAYFPVHALWQGRVVQLLHDPAQSDRRITPSGLNALPEGFDPLSFSRILLVRTRHMTSAEIAAHLGRDDICGIAAMQPPAALAEAPVQQKAYCAMTAAAVTDIRNRE